MPDSRWFTDARFGMFVHWGLYALPARHEWVQTRELRATEEYGRYARYFDPDLFDAREWARAAKAAGMEYAVLTTKHHDGFCLWDSALTDFTSMQTPLGRDVVAEFIEAVRAEGLKVGLYHSLLDWHHPDFTIDRHHPLRERADRDVLDATRDMARYRAYLHGQVAELLTNYGRIDYLFFDFSYEALPPSETSATAGKGAADWGSAELMALVRRLQPHILVNDRLDIPGDFVTPEQYQPVGPMTIEGQPVVWEACQTLNGSWGYDRDNTAFKSSDQILRMLIDGVSKDGNLLLNVGPTGRGDLEPTASDRLGAVGEWMRRHERSIRGAGASDFVPPPDARYTRRGDRLYLHLFSWPLEYVHLPGLAGRVDYAQLLTDASEVPMVVLDPDAAPLATELGGQPPGTLTLRLPARPPGPSIQVVEMFLAPE